MFYIKESCTLKPINTITDNINVSRHDTIPSGHPIEVAVTPSSFSSPATPPPFKFSKYQEAVFDWIKNDTGNLMLIASAGSGKTTTIEQSIKQVPRNKSRVAIAFNTDIVAEIKKRLPHENITTFHGLGLRTCIYSYGNVEVVQNKQRNIINNILLDINVIKQLQTAHEITLDSDIIIDLKQTTNSLCGYIKNTLLTPTQENIKFLINRYSIDTIIPIKLLTDVTEVALHLAKTDTRHVDFNDMCWIPVINNLGFKKYQWIFADEGQDISKCQAEMILRSMSNDGRVMVVADPRQAIYAFRGVDSKSVPNLIKSLNAKILTLPVSYRCAKNIVLHAQQFAPEIQYAENAIDGIVQDIDEVDFYNNIKPGDMVLSRYNKYLIPPAFELLSKGINVCIKGRDIGENLIVLIKRFKARIIEEFHDELEKWRVDEIKKCEIDDKSPELIDDKYSVLKFLSEKCHSPECIVDKIRKIFSDNNATIEFSTIHKAKGLESQTVYVLNPSSMPSKYARNEDDMEQEINIQYVGYTRPKTALYKVKMKGRK